jgi:hypothetical protein
MSLWMGTGGLLGREVWEREAKETPGLRVATGPRSDGSPMKRR